MLVKAQEEEDENDIDNNEEEDDNADVEKEDDEDYFEDEDHPGHLWKVVQEEFNCKKCDQKVMGNTNLRKHMQNHIKDQKVMLTCYYCEYKTVSENDFLNHISSVHGSGHICLTCNNTFISQEEMIKHVVDNYPKAKKKVYENVSHVEKSL